MREKTAIISSLSGGELRCMGAVEGRLTRSEGGFAQRLEAEVWHEKHGLCEGARLMARRETRGTGHCRQGIRDGPSTSGRGETSRGQKNAWRGSGKRTASRGRKRRGADA